MMQTLRVGFFRLFYRFGLRDARDFSAMRDEPRQKRTEEQNARATSQNNLYGQSVG